MTLSVFILCVPEKNLLKYNKDTDTKATIKGCEKRMIKIDCLGQICPVPMIQLQKHIHQIQKGEIVLIVTDHSCTLTSIRDFCKGHGFSYESEEVITGVWEVKVCKTN